MKIVIKEQLEPIVKVIKNWTKIVLVYAPVWTIHGMGFG